MPFDPTLPFEEVEDELETLSIEPKIKPSVSGFDPTQPFEEVESPEEQGILRQVADIPLGIARGGVTGIKMMTDILGADNPVSKSLSGVEGYMADLMSAQAKEDQQEISRIMKDAEDKGFGEQVKAGIKAFSIAPVDIMSQALGTMAPVIATGLAGSAAKLGALGMRAVQAGVGAGMGAGMIKGEIYNEVKNELVNSGIAEDAAEKAAVEAQSYGGKNLDQILLGAGLGAASTLGAEGIITRILTKQGTAPAAGVVSRVLKGGLTEAAPEAAQAAQEQLAKNVALQREGFDVDPSRGVVAAATMEAVAAAPLGGIAGAVERPAPIKTLAEENLEQTNEIARKVAENGAPLTASAIQDQAATNLRQDELAKQLEAQLEEELVAVKEPTAAAQKPMSKDEFKAIYSQVAPEELDAAEAGFTNTLATAATEEARANAQNALEAIKEVKATVTPTAPTVEPTITTAVTPAVPTAQPPITDATQEIIQPEGVRQEPQDGTQVQPTEEAGVGDSLLGAARGQEEGQVVPTPTVKEGLTVQPTEQAERQIDTSHLDALELGLSNARMRSNEAKTPQEKRSRDLAVRQYEKEIAQEKEFLGIKDEPVKTDSELLAELGLSEEPTIREVPEISPIVGAEPAAIVEQEPVAPAITEQEVDSEIAKTNREIASLESQRKAEVLKDAPRKQVIYGFDDRIKESKERLKALNKQKDAFYYGKIQEQEVGLEDALQAEADKIAPRDATGPLSQAETITLNGLRLDEEMSGKLSRISQIAKDRLEARAAAPTPPAPTVAPAESAVEVATRTDFTTAATREEAGEIGRNIASQDPNLPPPPPPQFEVLESISNSQSRKAYNPDVLTEEAINEARENGFIIGKKVGKFRFTESGRNQLREWSDQARDRSLALDALRDEIGDIAVSQWDAANAPESAAAIAARTAPAPVTTPPVTEAVTPAPEAAPTPAGISVGNRIKLGKSPQTYTIEEVIPQSATERELGEQYYSVKNERTGETQVVEARDLRQVKGKGARKMAAATRNEEYMRLAQNPEANREQLQSMVDEAAKKAGYDVKGYHGGKFDIVKNTEFEPGSYFGLIFFADRFSTAKYYAENDGEGTGRVTSAFLQGNIFDIDNNAHLDRVRKWVLENDIDMEGIEAGNYDVIEDEAFLSYLKSIGFDGITTYEQDGKNFAVFNPNQIKSAEPVTYDDAGNIIPLEERFQPTSPDIRRQAIDTTPEGILITPPDQQYTFNEVFDVAYDMFGGEIPEGFTIVNDSKDKDFEFKAAYIPESGEIIVNLAYLNKNDDIRDAITHELGHYIYGDPEFRAAFDQFIASLSPEARADLDAYVDTAYNKETGEIRLEEKMVRAFVDQFINEENAPAWRSMLDAIKRFLNKLGFKFNISDRDAISVFTAALDRYKAGEAISREGGARKIIDDLTAMDAEYLAAVEEAKKTGDFTKVQRMVDEAAKKAGRRNESGALINLDTGVVISESHAGVPIKQNWQDNVTFNDAGISAITTGDSPVAITHTHPDESGLSDSDMRMLGWSNVKKVQAVTPSGVVYTITKPEGSSAYPRKIEDTWNKIENEIFESGRSLEMSVPQIIREINTRASNELGFIYSESENQLHPLKFESITYDDAGDVIPLSQRFRPTSPDIRRMAAEPAEATPADEARREEFAGMQVGRIVTTPPGIKQKTTDIIRAKFFDSTKVSPESTSQAWAYISQFMDKADNSNNKFAGYVNNVTELELPEADRRGIDESIGAVMLQVELANYAGRLAVQGDTKMLAYMIRNGNRMPTGEYAQGVRKAGKDLNAVKDRIKDQAAGFAAFNAELKSNVERLASTLFGTNNPNEDQIAIAQQALTDADNIELGDANQVAADIKEVETRTNKDILKKIDDLISGYDNPKKDQLLLIFANLIRSRDVDGITISYKSAKVSISDRIANLLVKNLANYRDTLVDKAASGLESTFWRTMSSQENKPGLLGELDQAQNNELAKIVKATLIKMKLAGEPKNTKMTDIEKVASILNESKLSEEKRIEADKRIVAEIERRRQEELSTTNNPDAVNAKYDSILKAWNDSMSRQLNMPVSDSMLQRLISSEMKEQDIKIRDLVDEADGKVVAEKKQNIINSIIRKIYGVSKESETGIEMDENYDGLKSYLEQTLDNMYALSVEEKNAAYAKRQAKISLRNTADSQAQSIINRLADQLSDTPAFPEKQENEVKAIVQQDLKQIPDMNRKQPWTSQLAAKLMRAGVSEAQAQTISDLVWRQHEIKAMDRESKELQTAAEKGSLAVIIDRIKNTPLEKQQSPEWKQDVIKEYLRDAGLSTKAAETAAKLYDSVISERLAAAKQKAFEATLAKAAPWKDYASRNSKLAKDALRKIQDAIRTGVLDPDQTTESIIAAQNGWTGFTKEQYQRIVEIDTILNDPKQDDVTKKEALAELNKIITVAKLPAKFKEAIADYYVGQALLGIPTFSVNMASPAGFSIRNILTDIAKYAFTDPKRIPIAFESLLDSMRSWYGNVSYSFRTEVYPNDVVEYLQGGDALKEIFNRGKKQWAEGKYAEGFTNMAVGMAHITKKVLSALDQGAISMIENQNLTRYAMEALSAQKKIPKDQIRAFGQSILAIRNQSIAQSVSEGMPRDRAIVLADLAAKSELIYSLSRYDISPDEVLNSAINDALQSVGRNRKITIKGIEESDKAVSDTGTLTYLPIRFLEMIAEKSMQSGPAMQVFSKMVYGFALIPARVFSNVAWFSPVGAYRFAVDAFAKSQGWKSPYAMSLGTGLQYRQRLTETIAGSIVMLGLVALRSDSTEDDEDKKFKIVITGNGPNAVTDKQYYDSWMKKWKPYSIHIVVNGTIIPINIGRGGEALFFPIMLAGALDDLAIKKKQNLTKKEPEDLVSAVEVLGSSFFALAQRGPYAAFTKPLFDASKQGRVTEELASQAGYFGKTFIPVLGTSLARNITDFINDPVDRSSVEGAIYANTPVVGPWLGTKALNALGQPIRADDWGDKLFKLGVPVVFSFPKNTPENALNELILKQGGGPTIPTRSNAQKRFGDILTDKEFETYVREYGRVMSEKMFKNRTKLANMKAVDYDDELEKYARGYSIDGIKIKGASDSAVLAVKRMRQ